MNEEINSSRSQARIQFYEIELEGHLEPKWCAWFEGCEVFHEGERQTRLIGPVVDQAALHGLMRKVRDLGVPLISVRRLSVDTKDLTARKLIDITKPKNDELAVSKKER